MSWVADVRDYLGASGVATPGVDLFAHQLPDAPDDCTAVITASGEAPEWINGIAGPGISKPHLQVVARSFTPETAYGRVAAAYKTLCLVVNTAIGGSRYLWIRPLQEPFLMGRDQNDRLLYSANFTVSKEPE